MFGAVGCVHFEGAFAQAEYGLTGDAGEPG
jgi:hypothetical protein